ncbi:MAG: HEAT repeat domain-containing protein [Planctomycetota bacterium]
MTTEQLIDALLNSDPEGRQAAAQTLASLGEEAAPAAVTLARFAADADIGEWCVAALEEIGAPPSGDVGRLAELLPSADAASGYWSATLLGRLGPAAVEAVPALTDAASNAAEEVADRAVLALGKIGPAAASSLPALQALQASDRPRTARLAKQAIELIES